MTYDLGLSIVRWAEKEAIRKKTSVWACVADFLACGSTEAGRFCIEHMPKNGWEKITGVPEKTTVLAVEDIGDLGRKMQKIDWKWFYFQGKKLVECHVSLQPTWFKKI